ncbi:MAG: response regulator [Endomicrobium sp.]|jgi:DNA-binding NtrC family response regulator|uniref:response regulator n=1 Tax=Candidatus Endomicrobiellum cubanum TaxID=3242325 RepID=UPI002825A9FD|nr:response regulator [Endomicrobium sp.]
MEIKCKISPTILVVDDEDSLSFSLISILKMEGYEAVSANSGKKAIELIKNNKFDAAFFDIRLPDMKGVELLREAKLINNKLIVIMMTAYAYNDLIKTTIQEGAFRCLRKPFEVIEMLDLVRNLFKE